MKVLFAASEAAPFASTGGLGDVAGALPAALKRCRPDWEICVVIPMHFGVREKFCGLLSFVGEANVRLGWRNQYCGIWEVDIDKVKYYFIDNEYYFKRGNIYGEHDDGERYAYFCMAVLEMITVTKFCPDILHANDWQTAMSVVYVQLLYKINPQYERIRTVFTIHNIEYQGVCSHKILTNVLGLPESETSVLDYMGSLNMMKGAIALADSISTVSRQYAKEILTEYYGHGLHHILQSASHKLTGIVNGIDTDSYNPMKDSKIYCNFSKDNLMGKAKNKVRLQHICGLAEVEDIPLIAIVSRLAEHKGLALAECIMHELLHDDNVQLVVLGTGDERLEKFFTSLQNVFPDKCRVFIEFNRDLSRQIYAGADMFLMPSKSEPCGLSQMIASAYGAVPIVRETGGLVDTIHPYNQYDGTGNGFSFTNFNAHQMMNCIRFACEIYRDKKAWKKLVRRVMSVDFSWDKSAEEYVRLYESTSES